MTRILNLSIRSLWSVDIGDLWLLTCYGPNDTQCLSDNKIYSGSRAHVLSSVFRGRGSSQKQLEHIGTH